MSEYSVQDTNLEATRAKKAAILKGYMQDEFINCFVPENVKKEIILNRGYWARNWCVRSFVRQFIENAKEKVQILSLGCGFDTLPFNLLNEYFKSQREFSYFEIDLKEVVAKKAG